MIEKSTVAELIARSNRLGADPRNTNYAGGNTSAKGAETDPVTGEPVELLWVKGSGGDLGTLDPSGLAVLRLDRLRALVEVYPGRRARGRDGRRVRLLPARQGRGGAVDRHRDARAGRRAARRPPAPRLGHRDRDGRGRGGADPRSCFGDRVVWVPWRRPGFQLGLDIAAVARGEPAGDRRASSAATASPRGATPARSARRTRSRSSARRRRTSTSTAPGAVRRGRRGLRAAAARRARAQGGGDLAPTLRGLASTDRAQVGHYTDSDVVLDFLARERARPLAALGTSCPDHFLRTKVTPLVLDLPADGVARGDDRPAARAARRLPRGLRRLLRAARHPGLARRCAAPTRRSCWCPASACSPSARTSRPRGWPGEFYVNAINVMRGAEAVSSYAPDRRGGEVPHRVLGPGGGQARRHAEAEAARHPGRAASPAAASGIGRAIAQRLAAEGACVVVADRDAEAGRGRGRDRRNADVAIGVAADVRDEDAVAVAAGRACWPSAGSTWWSTTPGCRSPSRCWRPPRPTGTCSTT